MQRRRISRAIVVNPNGSTVQAFQQLLDAAGLESRCEIIGRLLEDSSLTPGSFDVITSMSGPAQIKNDSALVATMWTLLKPGGRLIMSLPCTFHAAGGISSHDWNEEADTGLFCLAREFMIRSFFRNVSFRSWVSQLPPSCTGRPPKRVCDRPRWILLFLVTRPRENPSRWRAIGVAFPEFRIFQAGE